MATNFNLQEILEFINANDYLAFDTETTGLNVRKDLVMGFGISNAESGFYIPVREYSKQLDTVTFVHADNEDIKNILTALQSKKLLMFNASFDARITKNNFGIDLLLALHTDVLLLKHTCDEEFPFGLKEIATKLWGHDVKKEKEDMQNSIKANGGTAKQYFKADADTLGRYCIQDCLLTFRLYSHYSLDLRKQGLESFYYIDEVLPLYKEVTIPMEGEGVHLNMPLLTSTFDEIGKDIDKLEKEILFQIEPHLLEFTEWFLNKEYPFKATGRVGKIMKRDGCTLKAAQDLIYSIEHPKGAFNLQSKHHLKKLFFDELHCTPLSHTPTGLPQVDDEFLTSIVGLYPWVSSIIVYNKLNKLKGTYVENFINDSEDGRYYPNWMQHRTVSGRLGGNLQQLPRPVAEDGSLVANYTNRIRQFLCAAPDSKLVSADYEQLEPTIFAHTSGDKALQQIFQTGQDFYSTVAIATEGLTGVVPDKHAPNYLGTISKEHRQRAKTYSLGIAYGMTAYKLQSEIGVSYEEAQALVASYFAAYPQLAAWMESSRSTARTLGIIKTQSGRIRHLQRASILYKRYGMVIEDDLALWKSYNHDMQRYAQAKLDRKEYKNLINNSINFQVQGLAASIVNRAALALTRYLKQNSFKSVIIGQIHDELILSIPNKELETVKPHIKRIMENIVELAVPLRTEPQSGDNYRQCK
jgi:DNA polymerase-1